MDKTVDNLNDNETPPRIIFSLNDTCIFNAFTKSVKNNLNNIIKPEHVRLGNKRM